MGDVLEMKRKVETKVHRFGHTFRVEYLAGVSPKESDPAAALYVDGEQLAWVEVGFAADAWTALVLSADEERILVRPEMVGMNPTTEDVADHKFLIEAEEYVLHLLSVELGRLLARERASEGAESADEAQPDPRYLPPHDRALRVLETWHNHGREDEHLPGLIAIEIYDALESMGMALADVVDEHIEEGGERTECGELVRGTVLTAIGEWKSGDP